MNGKTTKASPSENVKVAALLQLAASAPALQFHQQKCTAKLFELSVLVDILRDYKSRTHGSVRLVNPSGAKAGTAIFAGAPASADKTKYSYFELLDMHGACVGEAWISVQFETLSYELAQIKALPASLSQSPSSKHELDVLIRYPNPRQVSATSFRELIAGFSCKYVTDLTKASVREALGFRREMGFFSHNSTGSAAPWLVQVVPSQPATPLFLVSSSVNVLKYQDHVDGLGLYATYKSFP